MSAEPAPRPKADGDEPPPLWAFVPLAAAAPPPEPASETVRRGWRGLLRRLFTRKSDAEEDAPAELAGEPWPEEERDQWVPRVDQRSLIEALDARMGHDSLRQLVVGPPDFGLGEMLAAVGRQRGWRVLTPPGPEALLADPDAAVAALVALDDEPAVLTGLEGMFVRTPAGLKAMRDLLRCLLDRQAPTIAACTGWAWRYLTFAVDAAAAFPEPLTLEPFDVDRLERWLRTQPARTAREPKGAWVLRPADDEGNGGSSFLTRMAAAARGDPRVARAIWAEALRRPTARDEESGADAKADLWVTPWQQLSLPELTEPSRDELMLLQLVLLHGALSEPVLRALSPEDGVRTSTTLARLTAMRVLSRRDGLWRVPALAYPGVRNALAHHGFWLETPADGWEAA